MDQTQKHYEKIIIFVYIWHFIAMPFSVQGVQPWKYQQYLEFKYIHITKLSWLQNARIYSSKSAQEFRTFYNQLK